MEGSIGQPLLRVLGVSGVSSVYTGHRGGDVTKNGPP